MRKIIGCIRWFDKYEPKKIGGFGGIILILLNEIIKILIGILVIISIAIVISLFALYINSDSLINSMDYIIDNMYFFIDFISCLISIKILMRIYREKKKLQDDDIEIIDDRKVILNKRDYKNIILFSLAEIIYLCGALYFISMIPVPDSIAELKEAQFDTTFIEILISVVIMAPIFEEILFRGILLKGLLKKYKRRVAVILGAGLFCLMHIDPQNIIAILPGSIIYCSIYSYTKSIVPTMIMHFSYNLMTMVLDVIFSILNIEELKLIPSAFVIVLGISGMIYSYKRLNLKNRYDEIQEESTEYTLL